MRVERIHTFRYYCLDDDGRIIVGKFIEVASHTWPKALASTCKKWQADDQRRTS